MRQCGLVDIEMILDTRYGVLARMDEEVAESLAASTAYRERTLDNFGVLTGGKIDQCEYDRLYAEKSVETLAASKMSDFVHELRQDVKRALDNMDRGVLIDDITFHVNVWPYQVSVEEMEIIRRAIGRWIPVRAEVVMVNIAPETLTPKYIDTHYEMVALYNHEVWLKHHVQNLLATPIPTVVFLTPQIGDCDEMPAATEEIGNPFLCRSAILVQWIALTYLPTFHVCYSPIIHQLARNLQRSENAHPDDPLQDGELPVVMSSSDSEDLHAQPPE